MVSAKDLRDLFEEIRSEAGKRASDFASDAKVRDIGKMKLSDFGRRSEPPGIVWLGVGLVFGAIIGVAIALIAAPFPGEETRRRFERDYKAESWVRRWDAKHLRQPNSNQLYLSE